MSLKKTSYKISFPRSVSLHFNDHLHRKNGIQISQSLYSLEFSEYWEIEYLRHPSLVAGSQEAANSNILSLVSVIHPNWIHTGSKEPVTGNL